MVWLFLHACYCKSTASRHGCWCLPTAMCLFCSPHYGQLGSSNLHSPPPPTISSPTPTLFWLPSYLTSIYHSLHCTDTLPPAQPALLPLHHHTAAHLAPPRASWRFTFTLPAALRARGGRINSWKKEGVRADLRPPLLDEQKDHSLSSTSLLILDCLYPWVLLLNHHHHLCSRSTLSQHV